MSIPHNRCWYCGVISDRWGIKGRVVRDHIVPKSKGGSNDPSNIRPACWSCNSAKGRMTVEEFRDACSRRAAGWPYFTRPQLEWLRGSGVPWPARHVFWAEREGRADLAPTSDGEALSA